MATEQRCVVCGGTLEPAVAHPRSAYTANGEYRIDACRDCGAGMTLPRPTDDDLERCYARSYGYSTHHLIEPEKRRRSAQLLRWSRLRSGRILDIGCMYGFLLDEGSTRGLETFGVELSADAAAIAADKGHHVTTGTVEAFAAAHPEPRFDAIFAQHVLEHIADPIPFLTAAHRLLVPGGVIVACVPNFAARLRRIAPRAWGWYQVPFHLVHYTPKALTLALRGAGFTVSDTRTRGGDTLFLALSAAQLVGLRQGPAMTEASPVFARAMLRLAGELTRPYYRLGDDELAIVARA